MDRLVYTGLSALRAASGRQAATAHNLANAQTPGFRADMFAAQAMWLSDGKPSARAMASEAVLAADMRAGTITQTGRDLDIAMQGDAMLSVQAQDGDEAYTRRGDLQLTATGVLTTGDGHPVIGEDGPVTLPPADSVTIDDEGRVWIIPVGGDPAQPTQAAKIKLATPTGSDTVKGSDGLFRVRGGGALPGDPDARVITRSIESSNVSATQALIDMIDASRSWDWQLKMISDVRNLDTATTALMRLEP